MTPIAHLLHGRTADRQLTEASLKMVRDQVLVVTEKGESETDAGIVIAASVSGVVVLLL